MFRSLGTLDRVLALISDADIFLQALGNLDLGFLRRLHVHRLESTDVRDGLLVDAAVIIDGELVLPAPGFPALTLAIGTDGSGQTFLQGAVRTGARPRLQLYDTDFLLRLDQPLLQPVSLTPGTPAASAFAVRLRGGLTIDRALNVDATFASFSLPPFAVAGTGLVLELLDCTLDLSANTTPGPLMDLGFDEAFQGVYASSARLHWLPQAVFDNLPSLRVDLADVGLGTGGMAFDLHEVWRLDHDGRAILPTSELHGYLLDPAWEVAVSDITATVRRNVPEAFSATGMLHVPFLDTLLALELGLRAESDGFVTALSLTQPADASPVALAGGAITFRNLQVSGTLDVDSLLLSGSVSGALDLSPFVLTLDRVTAALTHAPGRDALALELDGLDLGPLGTVDTAVLRITQDAIGAGQAQITATLDATLRWADLTARLDLASLPAAFPLPPDDATVTASVSWEDDGAGGVAIVVRFAADAADPNTLWPFLPVAFRPHVADCHVTAEVRYADVAAFTSSDSTSAFTATFTASLAITLPALPAVPGMDLLTIHTGNADGTLHASVTGGIDGTGEPFLHASFTDLLTIDVDLPGLKQPDPFVHATIDTLTFDLNPGAALDGGFTLSGSFTVRPVAPPVPAPLAPHLQTLLAAIPDNLGGDVRLAVRIRGGRAALTLDGTFTGASVEIDVLAMLAALAQGRPIPPSADPPSTSASIPALPLGFALDGVSATIGTLDDPVPDVQPEQASIALKAGMHLGDLAAEFAVRLSDRECSFGLSRLDIPLRLPRFPLPPADVAGLATDSAWEARLRDLGQQRDALDSADPAHSRLVAQVFLLEQIFGVRQRVHGAANRRTYEDGVSFALTLLDAATSIAHVDSDLILAVRDVRFVFPFADPRDIRVEGSARIAGFAQDDPLRPIEDVTLTLGLSADTLFFSVDSLGQPIPLPDFGRYPGGSVTLSRLTIGYGFTRNSLSITFRGALVLPRRLIADADTSDVIGAGIVLPRETKLGFRFDLVPVPGPIPVIPLIEFDLDLRSTGVPGIAATAGCTPVWDGLQLNIPGVIRADVKRVAISPVFGTLPIPNARYTGDLALGTDNAGLTVVMDDFLFMAGIGTPPNTVPIAFLCDPTQPYFENFCVNVRVAGFGLNFNLQRPLPRFSPLALLEALGLIADPTMPIDPQGELANTIRVGVTDVSLTVPSSVRTLFPELGAALGKPTNVTLNLGTVIVAVQAVAATVGEIVDAVSTGAASLSRQIAQLTRTPPAVALGEVLAALPPEMRKIRTGATFAGFEARAVIVLIDSRDTAALRAAFAQRDASVPAPAPAPTLRAGQSVSPTALAHFQPNLAPSHQTRIYEPDAPRNSVFAGSEFASFTAADLADIPPHRDVARGVAQAGVIVGAYVKIFGGQRYRFLGFLFADGSFGMVTALDIPPLRLSIAGIKVSLPLEIHGRLSLTGRARRGGFAGAVRAEGFAAWNVIPGMLRVEAGDRRDPVRLQLHSDGAFSLRGSGRLLLFNGTVRVLGSVDISESHCFVAGVFDWQARKVGGQPLIALHLACEGRVGPGPHFTLSGTGDLAVLGKRFVDVSGSVSEAGATVSARLDTREWSVNGVTIPCRLRLAVRGSLDLRQRARPTFALDGEGQLDLFGLTIAGRGGVRAQRGALTTYLEGSLRWQGREWLGGRVEIGATGIRISGQTSFALALSPPNLAGIELAHLFIRVELTGNLTLDAAGGLTSFSLKGDWMLGARAAGTDQFFPLAAQRLDLSGGAALDRELLHVQGFQLVPLRDFTGITLPIPVFAPSTPPDPIEFGIGPVLGVPSPGLRWGGRTLGGDITDAHSGQIIGEIPLAFAKVSDTTTLTLPFDLTSAFRVALMWRNGRLVLKVTRGAHVRFVNL